MGGLLINMGCSIFIDGNNFYHGLRHLYGKDKSLKKFNFERFIKLLTKDREIIDIFYYNAQLDIQRDKSKFRSQKEFFDKLSKIPKLKLILCKLLKRKVKGTDSHYYVLKEDDIHMAVDLVEGTFKDLFDVAILVSGDGDFVPAVLSVQKGNKEVENVFFKTSSSRTLEKHCNRSLELTKDILDNLFDEP